ncbi:hypothetical protein R6Q57_020396 [Mikania cordata]
MAIQVNSSSSPSSPPATIHRSSWHSPVPYLFGCLAAMLTLIAFALLILAYSYWKLSNEMQSSDEVGRDLEPGNLEHDPKPDHYNARPVFEQKYLVIMAGDVKPTFLATPICGRATSFGGSGSRSNSTSKPGLDVAEEKKGVNRE